MAVPGVVSLLGEEVVAIVDHHNDEGRYKDILVLDDTRDPLGPLGPLRVIEPAVGSTCSLLANLMVRYVV